MSSTRQTVVRGPSLTGGGKAARLDAFPPHGLAYGEYKQDLPQAHKAFGGEGDILERDVCHNGLRVRAVKE